MLNRINRIKRYTSQQHDAPRFFTKLRRFISLLLTYLLTYDAITLIVRRSITDVHTTRRSHHITSHRAWRKTTTKHLLHCSMKVTSSASLMLQPSPAVRTILNAYTEKYV